MGTQLPLQSGDTAAPERASLRDAHKRRTRAALRSAALNLFLERGFDSATTEEIAERAGVSARTFFRYFPTKESVLFQGEQSWGGRFTQVYAEQPAGLSDIAAIRAALCEVATTLPSSYAAAMRFAQIAATSGVLRGRELEHQKLNVEKIARAVAARRGLREVDPRSRLLGAFGVMVYRQSLDIWLEGGETVPFIDVVAEHFDMMDRAFA